MIDAVTANSGISISHDPFGVDVPHIQSSNATNANRSGDWLELHHWRMKFDCLGLAPGPAVAMPDVVQRFNLPVDLDVESLNALALVPGPHLADAANGLPVVRSMLDVAATLTDSLKGVSAVCWSPAKSAIAPRFFSGAVRNWIDGGPFPALGLTSLSMSAAGTMETSGPVEDTAELQVDRDLQLLLQPMPGGRIEVTLM